MSEERSNQSPAGPPDLKLPGQAGFASSVRATLLLASFLALTLPLMPVQWLLLHTSKRYARTFPHWYHRLVCRLLGIRIHVDGELPRGRPALIVANHVSWLDIPVLSAVAPVSFVAKSEVGTWPFVSWLAKLQRTVFVDRKRRIDVGRVAGTMRDRLAQGDTLILFAEGTSTDGNRVLPFRSALLSPAFSDRPPGEAAQEGGAEPTVQMLSLVYTHLHGIPLSRAERKLIGWYGDMEMGSHAWELLKAGPLDAHVVLSKPAALSEYDDRKHLARAAEQQVRDGLVGVLRGRGSKPLPDGSEKPS